MILELVYYQYEWLAVQVVGSPEIRWREAVLTFQLGETRIYCQWDFYSFYVGKLAEYALEYLGYH
jgi:hypothetical protein